MSQDSPNGRTGPSRYRFEIRRSILPGMDPVDELAQDMISRLSTAWWTSALTDTRHDAEALRAELRRLAREWRLKIRTRSEPALDEGGGETGVWLVVVFRISEMPWDPPLEEALRAAVERLTVPRLRPQ